MWDNKNRLNLVIYLLISIWKHISSINQISFLPNLFYMFTVKIFFFFNV